MKLAKIYLDAVLDEEIQRANEKISVLLENREREALIAVDKKNGDQWIDSIVWSAEKISNIQVEIDHIKHYISGLQKAKELGKAL